MPTCRTTSDRGPACARSPTSAPGRLRCSPFEGQGRDDQVAALDLAYVVLVGRLAHGGRRATEEEVRAFFAHYEEYAGLAGIYALGRRYL